MLRNLIFVPTDQERRIVAPLVGPAIGDSGRVELCGFGMVAAAARTAQLIAERRPRRVILVGIAGALDDRLAVGDACRFGQVSCYGIGAGSGDGFQSAESMGWQQWPGDPPDPAAVIGDTISCDIEAATDAPPACLLTVCAAAASEADVIARRRMFPAAVAEDMEGFAVALACRLHGVPVDIVRGISNTAGDRDASRWQIEAACRAAAELAAVVLGGFS